MKRPIMAGLLAIAAAPSAAQDLAEREIAERISGALNEERANADRGEVRIAQLFGLVRRMERITEEQESIELVALRRQVRRHAAAHRLATDDELPVRYVTPQSLELGQEVALSSARDGRKEREARTLPATQDLVDDFLYGVRSQDLA